MTDSNQLYGIFLDNSKLNYMISLLYMTIPQELTNIIVHYWFIFKQNWKSNQIRVKKEDFGVELNLHNTNVKYFKFKKEEEDKIAGKLKFGIVISCWLKQTKQLDG